MASIGYPKEIWGGYPKPASAKGRHMLVRHDDEPALVLLAESYVLDPRESR
jgi:hypothetical protein